VESTPISTPSSRVRTPLTTRSIKAAANSVCESRNGLSAQSDGFTSHQCVSVSLYGFCNPSKVSAGLVGGDDIMHNWSATSLRNRKLSQKKRSS